MAAPKRAKKPAQPNKGGPTLNPNASLRSSLHSDTSRMVSKILSVVTDDETTKTQPAATELNPIAPVGNPVASVVAPGSGGGAQAIEGGNPVATPVEKSVPQSTFVTVTETGEVSGSGVATTQPEPKVDVTDAETVEIAVDTDSAPESARDGNPVGTDLSPTTTAVDLLDGGQGWAALKHFAHRPDNLRRPEEYTVADPEFAALVVTVQEVGVLQSVAVCAVEEWLRHHPGDSFGPDVRWVVMLGNRRFAAAVHVGLQRLPFLRNDRLAIPRHAREAGLIENLHRKGSDPILEAKEMIAVRNETRESQREFAKRLGFSHTHIQNCEALVRLIPGFQELVSKDVVKPKSAKNIAKLSTEDQQRLLDLGLPYNIARLTPSEPDRNDGSQVATFAEVRIQKGSTSADVAKLLRERFPAPLLEELRQLLFEEGTDEQAVAV